MYILEAHFVEPDMDGWPVGTQFRHPQHKTLEDRLGMVAKWKQEYPNWNIPTYIDTMDNTFNEIYACWPDRGYIFSPSKSILYIANTDENGHRDCAWTTEMKEVLNL